MTTVHANSPRDAFSRLETMALFAESGLTNSAVREQLASAINIVVQTGRLVDGQRRCLNISEVRGLDNGGVDVRPIWRWEQTGIRDGIAQGHFRAAGYAPRCLEQIESFGMRLDRREFEG